jgi:hypothetical protein
MKNFCTAALVSAFALSVLLIPASEARSDTVIIFDGDTYAAIAYSPATGKIGCAYNYGSRFSAEQAALGRCPAADARIVGWVHNGFCALAVGADKSCWGVGYSYGDGATNRYAKQRALYECSQRSSGGRVLVCVCSENVAPEAR